MSNKRVQSKGGDNPHYSRDVGEFLKVVRRLLLPIARFCLSRGLRMQEVAECLKGALIDAAEERLANEGALSNTSRLAVLTGLQRRDVLRRQDESQGVHSNMNLLNKVVGRWLSHPDFSTKKGGPRSLSVEGANSEFSELVQSLSADVNPYTVLFALRQAKLVEDMDNQVRLKSEGYVPSAKSIDGLLMLAEDASDLIRAVEENVLEEQEIPNLHLTTVYDNIATSRVSEIRNWLLEEGTKFHQRVREYLSQFDKDSNAKLFSEEGGARVMVCAFSVSSKNIEESNSISKGKI